MARGLYRVYLYFVTIAMLVFAAVGVGNVLYALLQNTPLWGSAAYKPYASPESGSAQTQQIVFGVAFIVVALLFGALHYWLIRRDMVSDAKVGDSSVRSFMLNLAIAIATVVAVIAGASALQYFSFDFRNDITVPLSAAIAALVVALPLTWEQRRATPTHGAALVFQRLRTDGVGFILVVAAANYLVQAIHQTEVAITQSAGIQACTTQFQGPDYGYRNGPYLPMCVGSQTVGYWAAAALVVGVWLVYVLVRTESQRSVMRAIFLLLGFGVGAGFFAYSATQAVEYILRLVFEHPGTPDYLNKFDFAPPMLFGALAVGVYVWLLRQAREQEALGAATSELSLRAVAGAIFAAPFWVGVYLLIEKMLLVITPGGTNIDLSWYTAIAVTLAGAPYVALAFWLGSGTRAAEDAKGPRRAFVLALLAAGALATAGGAATLIYSVLTSAFGAPLGNWQDVARIAGAILITGLALGGLYLYIALREGQFAALPKVQPAAGEAPTAATTLIEGVLAKLTSGSISKDEATAEILDLARHGSLT